MVSIGGQFSTGDQNQATRERFWSSGFSTCQNPNCPSLIADAEEEEEEKNKNKEENLPSWAVKKQKSSIQSVDHVAGCRMNGDAYGTTVFTCTECNWKTSFQYDEASDDSYYYETRFWDRNLKSAQQQPPPPPPPHPWAKVNVYLWLRSLNIDQGIISKCRTFGLLDGPTISGFGRQQFLALSFTKEETNTLLAEIAKKDEEVIKYGF